MVERARGVHRATVLQGTRLRTERADHPLVPAGAAGDGTQANMFFTWFSVFW